MKAFWAGLAKYAVKVAAYAAGHPDQLKLVVQAVLSTKK